jgi:F-type H+-transporting ATPase subunit h
MYLQQLKTYKPPPLKANDADGHVQKFTLPKPPKSPEETDIAKDLKAYENQTVEVEGQSSESGAPVPEEDWFEEEEEEAPAAAH